MLAGFKVTLKLVTTRYWLGSKFGLASTPYGLSSQSCRRLFATQISRLSKLSLVPPLCLSTHYVRLPHQRWGASGESEGKAPEGPAPLRTAQRNLIYGKGSPEGCRFHMNDEAA